ncbi:DNA mismatch repair endonuclease MutL [Levilactobacillus bambusae]|uniref:DNA mismatch repair protein MutL n=1 Tax=Levilactobacillus bambusae TaxID=2024736 RepID=A0A2V1MYL7_9LACO|nr:DNA mismatch repair endonuclease MutL [Levilactobacillus bambusae]PWF99577.1 DNA mismatch repair endonuclease MutL [Levilactobacillus bambusae]
MSKIQELPTVLTNQITAGEVIERPASVVKELVENAIDAHSTEIDINVEEAGLKRIQIIDDGDGIPDGDAEMAFKRHATSKIATPDDLLRVHSLGFRGEALPSIASISDTVLTTSTGDSGTLIHITGGDLVAHKPAQARRGTSVTVKDLFFNVPARKKYLKSASTELARITDIVNREALSHPEISFSFTHNGRELLHTTGRGDLLQVISAIYGVQTAKKMVAVTGQNEVATLSGFVSLPEVTRASRGYISVLLNGRFVRNQQLNKAIIAGYGSKLMVGRYPIGILNLEMDPALVDVNVHPTKQEVRISQEPELSKLLTSSIFDRLATENLIPDALAGFEKKREAISTDQLTMALNEASTQTKPQVTVQASKPVEPVVPPISPVSNVVEGQPNPLALQVEADNITPVIIHSTQELQSPIVKQFDEKYQHEVVGLPFDQPNLAGEEAAKETEPADQVQSVTDEMTQTVAISERFPQLQYVGQVHGTYLLAEAPDGMYILDQHAAQERVNYEHFRQAIGEVSDDQQKLLVPIVLDYPTADALRISDQLSVLAGAGLHLEPFGQNSFIVREHPTWFVAGQEQETIQEMVDWVLKTGHLTVAEFREKTAIMMSCKRAIKANHHLDDQQARALLKKLPTCENPFNCPHGRPVLVHFTNDDLEKMFKRIQDPHKSTHESFETEEEA